MITKISNPITWEELTSVLDYSPDTGLFVWKETRGHVKKGSIAGSLEDDGYITIRLAKKLYKAHRLAWFYCFKEWPAMDIDHIDRVRHNNTLDNLRELSRADNNRNSIARNASGIKHIYKNGKGYMVRIAIDGKDKYVGTYPSIEEALSALNIFKSQNNLE